MMNRVPTIFLYAKSGFLSSSNCHPLLTTLHKSSRRLLSSTCDEIRRQNTLFDDERKRQREAVGRIEKIQVEYEGAPENAVFEMNRGLSTPFDCAKHLGSNIVDRSAVALLNNDTLWHMHKPLPDSCKLQLLHYNQPQPGAVNKVFWRTCSFLLGAVITSSFKDNIHVQLHSFPSAHVRSGSFVYDVDLGMANWQPTATELKILSIEMIKFCQGDHTIQCMDVSIDLALDLFRNNPHKHGQIPDIAAHNGGRVTLYRAAEHIDISKGPMVPSTSHLGRITVANILKLDTDIVGCEGAIYRFQGVALPRSIVLNHFAYSLLEERARILNSARIPGSQETVSDDHSFVSAQISV